MGNTKKVIILALTLIGSVTLPVLAAENDVSNGSELNPVMVSAKKNQQTKLEVDPDHLVLLKSSTAVEVFTKKDIEAMRPRDVYDVIESAMGMVVSRQGARVHNFIYGRGGDSVGVIVDGVYMSATEAQRVLGDLPVEMIDSVTIVRDSTAMSMGPILTPGANTAPNQGFILITTRKAKSGESEIKVGYSTFNTQKYVLFTGDKIGDKGYFSFGYSGAKSDGKDGWNNGYENNTFLLNGGYEDKGFTSNMSFYINKGSREIQRHFDKRGTPLTSIAMWKYNPMDTRLFAFNMAKKWSEKNTTSLTYGYTDSVGDAYYYTANAAGVITNPNVASQHAVDRTSEINLVHVLTTGKNTLKFGTQIIDWYQLGEVASTATPNPKQEKLYGYYIFDENRVNDKLTLDGGMRLDKRYIVKGGNKYSADGNITQLDNNKWANDAKSYSVGAAYQLDPVYKLSTRISYTDLPTAETLTTVNNAELPSEKRLKYEIGINGNYSEKFNVSVTPFYYDIKDAKVVAGTQTTTDGNTVNTYTSANHLIRKGVEVAFKGKLSDYFTYNAGYTWYTSSNADERAKNPKKYTMRLGYKKDSVEGNITLLRVDSYESISTSNGVTYRYPVGNFTIINASISKLLDKNTKVTLYGQNLTDKKYSLNYKGYPQEWGYFYDVGRTVGIEVSRKF